MDRRADTYDERPRVTVVDAIALKSFVLPACAFIVGIVVCRCVPGLTLPTVVLAGTLVAAVPLVHMLRRGVLRRRLRPAGGRLLLTVLVVILSATCGYLRTARRDVLAPDDLIRLVGKRGAMLRVRGTIDSRPQYTEEKSDGVFRARDYVRTRFDFRIDSVETTGGWEPASGLVRVNVYDRAADFAYGDRLQLLAIFRRPREPTSLGQFDYRQYLRRRGILLQTSLPSRRALGQPLAHHYGSLLKEVAHGLSARAGRTIDRWHSPREAGLLKCVLLGERDAVDYETEQTFRLSGLSHLLAVSGLHVVILIGGLWIVLRLLGVHEPVIVVVAIVVALTYAGMADFRPSVMRATIAIVIVALGRLLGRRADMVNLLAIAALVVLLFNPDEVFFAGFQLSFIAVLTLVGLTNALRTWLIPRLSFRRFDVVTNAYRWPRVVLNDRIVTVLAITVSAWLATQPLAAWHFNVVNIIAPLVNVLLVPLFAVTLFAGFVALLVETFLGGIVVATVSGGLARMLMGVSQTCARLPAAWINVPRPHAVLIGVYYVFLLLVLTAPLLRMRRSRCIGTIGLLLTFCLIVAAPLWPSGPEHVELVVLDVGMGSAAVVRTGEGRTAVVDAGSMSSMDIARWTIVPYLVRSGVPVVDVLILSHPDVDHISGLPMLLANIKVKKVLLGEDFKCSTQGARVERFLIDRGVDYDYVALGDVIDLGGVRLEVIHPPRDPKRLWRWNANESSAVVRGTSEGGRFLLSADVGARGLHDMASDEDLSADVLVAAHHGGFSGMEHLAREYRWPIVLFSARKGFINPERFAAYRAAGARTFTTYECGTIRVTFGDEITVSTYGD